MKKGRERALITPKYEPLGERPEEMTKAELDAYKSRRANTKGKNVGSFYKALYDVLNTDPEWRGKRLELRHPEEYGFFKGFLGTHSPDNVKLYRSGPVFTEIKATAHRNAKFWCSPQQFARYWLRMEARLQEGDKIPNVQYALFRYGERDDYKLYECDKQGRIKNKKRHSCNNRCLTRNLSKKIKDLTILPMNLLVALFMSNYFGFSGIMDQTTSRVSNGSVDYFWLKGITCSQFHGNFRRRPAQDIEELLGTRISERTYDVLCLRDLEIIHEESPVVNCRPLGFTGNPYLVTSFPVVRVQMTRKAEKEWIENFWEYGRGILRHSLHLMNLESTAAEIGGFEGEIPFEPIKVRRRKIPF